MRGSFALLLRIGVGPGIWRRKVLLEQLSKSSARFILGDHVLPDMIKDRALVDSGGNFRKTVEFSVSDRQHKVAICPK